MVRTEGRTGAAEGDQPRAVLVEESANARTDATAVRRWDADEGDEIEATGAEQQIGRDPTLRGAHDPHRDRCVGEGGLGGDGALAVDQHDAVTFAGRGGEPITDEGETAGAGGRTDEERLGPTETAEMGVEGSPAGEEAGPDVRPRTGDLGETLAERGPREP